MQLKCTQRQNMTLMVCLLWSPILYDWNHQTTSYAMIVRDKVKCHAMANGLVVESVSSEKFV